MESCTDATNAHLRDVAVTNVLSTFRAAVAAPTRVPGGTTASKDFKPWIMFSITWISRTCENNGTEDDHERESKSTVAMNHKH